MLGGPVRSLGIRRGTTPPNRRTVGIDGPGSDANGQDKNGWIRETGSKRRWIGRGKPLWLEPPPGSPWLPASPDEPRITAARERERPGRRQLKPRLRSREKDRDVDSDAATRVISPERPDLTVCSVRRMGGWGLASPQSSSWVVTLEQGSDG